MAPSANKRRRTSANAPTSTASSASASQQSTISFGRPTKPSVTRGPPSNSTSKKQDPIKPSKLDDEADVPAPATAAISLPSRPADIELDPQSQSQSQPEAELLSSDDDDDDEHDQDAADEATASKITDKQIKNYWADKEAMRKAPRVHQAGLSVRERVCREFDLESRYGPCTGIPRLHRWKRARALGLNPPIEVLAVLRKEMEDGAKDSSTSTSTSTSTGKATSGGKGASAGKGKKNAVDGSGGLSSMRGQKSVVDELIMSSRLRGGVGDGVEA